MRIRRAACVAALVLAGCPAPRQALRPPPVPLEPAAHHEELALAGVVGWRGALAIVGVVGLAVALMADISIMAEEARITDGHVRLGVSAGDHAVILWPLLCGLAKAKYYLMTADFVDGKEAERIGLVSLTVPRAKLMEKTLATADKLATGSQLAIRFTKRSLNNWMRTFQPAFDASLAMEMLCFLSGDVKEGVAAVREKREPRFPSAG